MTTGTTLQKRLARISFSAGLLAAAPGAALADDLLLGEWWLDWGQSTFNALDPINFLNDLEVGFRPGPANSTFYYLFESVLITESSVGTAFAATPANDPDFAQVATTLTNGATNNGVTNRTGYTLPNGDGQQYLGFATEESWASHTSAPADFSGFTLTKIELYIESLEFFPQPDQQTEYTINRRLRIYGEIPEPTTTAMLGVCLMPILARRARREARHG